MLSNAYKDCINKDSYNNRITIDLKLIEGKIEFLMITEINDNHPDNSFICFEHDSKISENIVKQQLKGNMEIEVADRGCKYKISFPLKRYNERI